MKRLAIGLLALFLSVPLFAASTGISGVLPGGNAPAKYAVAVIPHDTTNIVPGPARMLWVGSTGTVAAVMEHDSTVVNFVGVPSGTLLPIRVKRVNSTNTTASNIVALF